MSEKLNNLSGRLKTVGLGGILLTVMFIGGSSLYGMDAQVERMDEFTAEELSMHLKESLDTDVLNDVLESGQKHVLSTWTRRPVEIDASVKNGDIRIRLEQDFVIIWYRSKVPIDDGQANSPLGIVQRVTKTILGKSFVLGSGETLVRARERPKQSSRTRMIRWPEKDPKTDSIICSYAKLSNLTQRWRFIDKVHLLVKERNAIIVMEKAKARRFGVDNYVYEGLDAARAGLAKNTIFDSTNVGDISDTLLNGCMWSKRT